VIHAVGVVGLVLLLGGYFLVSTGRLGGQSVGYQSTNLAGAVVLIAYSWALQAWASVVLNLVWAGIAAVALLRARRT
jgi:hypothetical protein